MLPHPSLQAYMPDTAGKCVPAPLHCASRLVPLVANGAWVGRAPEAQNAHQIGAPEAAAVHWNRSNMKNARHPFLNSLYVSYRSRRSRRCCTSRRPFWAQFDINWTRRLTQSFSIACAAGSAAGAAVHRAGHFGRGGAACALPGRVLEGGHLYWAWPSVADCNTHQRLAFMQSHRTCSPCQQHSAGHVAACCTLAPAWLHQRTAYGRPCAGRRRRMRLAQARSGACRQCPIDTGHVAASAACWNEATFGRIDL